MHILSLSGRRKCGKSLAGELVCQSDPRFTRISFADILKDEYAKEAGIPRGSLDDILGKEKYRRGMQVFGDKKRQGNDYYFVTALINTLSPSGFYVIDDTRFIPELETIFKLGGIMCGIHSESHQRAARGWIFNPETDNDYSETELGDLSSETWNALRGSLIYNNGSKDHLKEKVTELVRKHFPFAIEDLTKMGSKLDKVR